MKRGNLGVASGCRLVAEVAPDREVFSPELSDQRVHLLDQLLVMHLDINVDGRPGELVEHFLQQRDLTLRLTG